MEKFPQLKEKVRVVIFCGGYGTRMWPMSRESLPKQFQPLLGEDSFFQNTYKRLRRVFQPEDIFVSTSADQIKFVKAQASSLPTRNIIAEPERRDTLGAIGYSAIYLDKFYPDSLMAVTWSDGYIRDEEKAANLFLSAAKVVQNQAVICMVQLKPPYPATHLGWVKIGLQVGQVDGYPIYKFEKHVEKPSLEKTKRMFRSNNWLINPGFYVWRTSTILSFYQKHVPEDYQHLLKIKTALGTKSANLVIAKEYSAIQKVSVDFGLFEKLVPGSQLVLVANLWWHDVGTWDLFYEAMARGQRQNIAKGEVEFLNSHGNLVYLPKKKIAAMIGVENLVVVDTPDGLLICRRGLASEVKKFVENLKEKNKKEYL